MNIEALKNAAKREFRIRYNIKLLAQTLREVGMYWEADRLMEIYEMFDSFFFAIKDELFRRLKERGVNVG